MRELNFWEFPDDIRIHLDDEINRAYWESVEEKAGSLAETARILSKELGRKISYQGLGQIKKGHHTSKKTKSGEETRRFPIEYLKIFEEELGIDYKNLQDYVESYSVGRKDKIIPEIDSERKLPIKFDGELLLALSSVMWSEMKQASTFVFKGPVEQRGWLYETFKEHFGEIPECKKTCRNWGMYLVPKAITHIGLNYIDNNINKFTNEESLAVILGSYAAKGINPTRPIGLRIQSKKPEPLKRLKTALNRLDIDFNERSFITYEEIYIYQKNADKVYSKAKKFDDKYNAYPFLESSLEYIKRCAESSRGCKHESELKEQKVLEKLRGKPSYAYKLNKELGFETHNALNRLLKKEKIEISEIIKGGSRHPRKYYKRTN